VYDVCSQLFGCIVRCKILQLGIPLSSQVYGYKAMQLQAEETRCETGHGVTLHI